MDIRARGRSTPEKVSDLDRQCVLDVIAECRAEGYLDNAEQELAVAHVKSAVDRKMLDEVLLGLPRRARDGSREGHRRATKAEREDAIRRLEMYSLQGAISPEERQRRVARVEISQTPDEISEVFGDLGSLDADKTGRADKLVSKQQRDEAIRQLNAHLAAERLTVDEHRDAVDQVRNARNRIEIDAAFRGLTSPRITTMQDGASDAIRDARAATIEVAHAGARAAKETRRRIGRALVRLALAGVALIAGIVLLIIGGTIVGVICFGLAVVLFVVAMRALFVGTSTA